ncbi:MAG: hypothetical protein RhofKO_38800 [Rhodothermales bacterium]
MPVVADRSTHAHIAARWNPTYSLLGRWMRRRVADRWQAQAYTVLAASGLLVALIIASFLAWGVWGEVISADPEGPVALRFWWIQAAAMIAGLVLTLAGWSPAIKLTVDEAGLTVETPHVTHTMPHWTIERVAPISAVTYHRHYRRYAGTTPFVGALPSQLLLVESEAYCWVLGLDAEAQAAVLHALSRHTEQRDAERFEVQQAPVLVAG